jgi:hypothetical protein
MSDFGDATPEDIYDIAPPDPEAVARILWDDLRREVPKRFKPFDDHTTNDKLGIIAAVGLLLARGKQEGWVR